ncbi:MAG: 50S ribosomal protein L17 [Parachlamydiales bacterium]|nr:50S ribosomal protein L17 [Verrucomicrobiota bacterium]MBX3718546.1 50S ribosomal protein L17 [Candidatus Acheromyda pituitae]
MRHAKDTFKIGRTASHRRCLMANMLKSLIENERIETTVRKAKELRRYADHMITLAKRNTLASRRQAIGELMITLNAMTSKEAREVKKARQENKAQEVVTGDRKIIGKLFDALGPRFANRNGGYTRIIKKDFRAGDSAPTCYIEYLQQ